MEFRIGHTQFGRFYSEIHNLSMYLSDKQKEIVFDLLWLDKNPEKKTVILLNLMTLDAQPNVIYLAVVHFS